MHTYTTKKGTTIPVIHCNSSEEASEVLQAILPTGDGVTVAFPQFFRTDNIVPSVEKLKELGAAYLDSLHAMHENDIKDTGCLRWDENLWLYPKEWFSYIPKGYKVCDIFDDVTEFNKDIMDDDVRFGVLSFGFRQSPGIGHLCKDKHN